MTIIDKHLPLKTHRVKNKQQPKWITPEIIEAIKTRDRYKSLNDDSQYKTWRNKVVKLIKDSKKAQYSEMVIANNNKPNSVWKLFKEIGVNKKKCNSNISSLKVDDNDIKDSTTIANEFNNFFVSVASNIKEPISVSEFKELKEFCDSKVPSDTYFRIPEISEKTVETFLKNLDVTKATGCDNIGARLLKSAVPFIVEHITYICNHSIKNSIFPDQWKEGKVAPLYKAGSKDDVNNYRPISILPILSKILEKHIHDSLMDFLIHFKLLHKTQSGFRPNHSCETALLGMINSWLEAINSGTMIGVVMVDFKKAFDLVDHKVLLKKMKHYKLSDDALSWFSSYLLNRKQKVSINNAMSEDAYILDGVPQGSILGPLLFIMFINDLPLYTNSANTDMYADDTNLYFSGESKSEIERNLQISLNSLSTWCKYNGMLLNTSKTKVMLITTYQKRTSLTSENLDLHFNNDDLNTITGDKILGIFVDNNLTWSTHIDKLCKKISANLWLLSNIKEFLSTEHRTIFYKTYIQPHIDYCNIVWGGTTQLNLNRIFRLQKRACKIIMDYNVENISECMQKLKILTVFERLYLRKAKFMYNIANSVMPEYINEMFHQRTEQENLPLLRSSVSQNFIPPRPNREIFKQSVAYSGPIIWNSLPESLKSCSTVNSFHCNFIKWMKSQ